MISNKHITKIAAVLISVVLVLCLSVQLFPDLLSPITTDTAYAMEYEDKLFDTSEVIDINILMDEATWQDMLDNALKEEYYECDVVINGTTFHSVGIRPKGNTSLSNIANDPDNNRYSFKLEFDQFISGQTCFGLDKLILNNSYADATNMKEAIIYDMFAFMDADASLYNYAKISVNDSYFGVYLALEAVEDSFMLRNYGTQRGKLYKPDSMDMGDKNKDNENKPSGDNARGGGMPDKPAMGDNAEGFTPPMKKNDTNETKENIVMPKDENFRKRNRPQFQGGEGAVRPGGGFGGGHGGNGANLNYIDDSLDSYSAIWDASVNGSTEADQRRVVTALKNASEKTNAEKYLDVDNLLKYMAVHTFAANEDSLSGSMAHNYYLYEANGKLNILPWDYNLCWGGMHGGNNASSVINDAIDDSFSSTEFFDVFLENEEYRKKYHFYYNELIEGYVKSGKFSETFNRITSQIDELVKTDPNAMYSYEEYVTARDTLYNVVMLRAESIRGQLGGSIPSTSAKQKEAESALIDASDIDLSVMGSMGGGHGGGPERGNREKAMISGEREERAESGDNNG